MATRKGTGSRDVLMGTSGNDTIYGYAGNDDLYGLAGNDTLYGGDGNDVLIGGRGADKLYGGSGVDRVSYATASGKVNVDLGVGGQPGGGDAAGDKYSSIEGVIGTKYGDYLAGGSKSDYIDGGAGGDVIRLGNGNDRVFGRDGNDYISSNGTGSDSINGGAGKDTVYYNEATKGVTVRLSASGSAHGSGGAAGDTFTGIESIWGSNFDDVLRAGKGGTVYGNPGDDWIYDAVGTTSREILAGGDGFDVLDDRRGKGADYFVLDGGGRDYIRGFNPKSSEGDRLAFLDWKPTSSELINSTDNHATKSGRQLIYETDRHVLWYDYDGTGNLYAPVELAKLEAATTTVSTLSTSYFVELHHW